MEEGVAVDLARHRVVDDVAGLEPLVVLPEPRIDPEGLDPHDLLLLVAHRARHVHHVDDDGVRLRERHLLPGAVAPVLAHRDDHRPPPVVRAARDLPPQRLLVGALEVAQRLGARGRDPGVAELRRDDPVLAPRLDAGEGELLAEDLGELLERHVHLEDVLPLALAGLAGARLRIALRERIARLAVALSDAALRPLAEAEVRDVDGRDGDGDELLPLLPDQLALLDVLLEVPLDATADDVAEARVVLLDLQRHAHAPVFGR